MPSKRSASPSSNTASAANGGSQSAPYAHVSDFRNMLGYVPPTAEERRDVCAGPPKRLHPVDQYATQVASIVRNCGIPVTPGQVLRGGFVILCIFLFLLFTLAMLG